MGATQELRKLSGSRGSRFKIPNDEGKKKRNKKKKIVVRKKLLVSEKRACNALSYAFLERRE